MLTAADLPPIIQGGMGVSVSSWQLASAVAQHGHLGVVSGTALDLVLARRLQNGDEDGHARRALAAFPEPDIAERVLKRYYISGGRGAGTPYSPIPRLAIRQRRALQELAVTGSFVDVWLAKEGHSGLVGINCLEKIQMSTPATLYGAMLAGVDAVLMGAGVPRTIPNLLNMLARNEPINFAIDVDGADDGAFTVDFDPVNLLGYVPKVQRPVFLAIVSSHVLALFLAREEAIRPDGFIVETPPAGGHNAPPRRPELDERGEIVFGPRDEPDLDKIAATGLPYWLAGAAGTPEALREALIQGAMGIQVGTVFALSNDSGIRPGIRDQMRAGIHDDSLYVRTDPKASPTGFPFKVAEISGTMSETSIYEARPRLCDLGYLRTAFVKADGEIGYRCPSEPVHMYVRKGGDIADTIGRQCLCNGLTATAGLAQIHSGGYLEAPVATLGSDLAGAKRLAEKYPAGWSAIEVINWLVSLSLDSPRIKKGLSPSLS
ncbi:MAG: nitronate monooxygenase [Actinobacteria bacterium]|uniref:Unannotated protein n=1 Tax=freshwater metagenome TaxID=449393 RepID=A0A6J6T8T5_9ZZZZ|nr:nitronate monooxygenase [Actinomycetota bacterium]